MERILCPVVATVGAPFRHGDRRVIVVGRRELCGLGRLVSGLSLPVARRGSV